MFKTITHTRTTAGDSNKLLLPQKNSGVNAFGK